MHKRIIIGAAVVLSLGLLLRVFSTPGRAQSVEAANAALATTEKKLADATTKSATTARALEQQLDDQPEQLPSQLQEFSRTTSRLHELHQELSKEIIAYDNARNAKIAEFDQEVIAIKDAGTRRHMERLRNRIHSQTTERLNTSRAAIAALQEVLAQGADLQHAARCVQIVDELHLQGQDLQSQVQKAKDQIHAYARLSTTLLARLTPPETAQ